MTDHQTTGRCRTCQKRAGIEHAFVYRWKRGKGRELYRARCPRCSSPLQQTTFSNLKQPHVSPGTPDFVKHDWETSIGKHEHTWRDPCLPGEPEDTQVCVYCRTLRSEVA